MDRRGFITTLASGLAVASVDPEALERLLWTKKKTIFIPPAIYDERIITLKAMVANINYSIFDVEHCGQQGQFAYLEAKDLRDGIDLMLKHHDAEMLNPTAIVVSPELHKHLKKVLKPPTMLERLFGW